MPLWASGSIEYNSKALRHPIMVHGWSPRLPINGPPCIALASASQGPEADSTTTQGPPTLTHRHERERL